ncbi:MAG: DUF5050 domain-containing protein [Lachnospiraceae bacterium]|nr:DUF5050 domain-containing protein [Lachnospiraceae bacterium]
MAGNRSKKGNILGGIVIVLIFAGLIGGGLTYNYFSKRVVKSAPGMVGNTAGNLYNLGLFCESDGRIYFSNYLDDGQLYSMKSDLTDFKHINEDYPRYLNADENYLCYSRMNNLKESGAESIFVFYANGVFRCRKNGKGLTMLHNKPVGSVLLYDNTIFYQNYIKNGKISIKKMEIDGSGDTEIIDDEVIACAAYDGRIYYTGFKNDHDLHSFSPLSGGSRVELEGNFYNAVIMSEGIYYIDPLDHYHLKLYSGGESKTLVNKKISAYNITKDSRYIYYQVDGTDADGVYIYDTVQGASGLIREGSYKWLNIAGGYCFFYSSDETEVFAHDQSVGLSYFMPPVLDK